MADQYPLGSDERLECLEEAHACFMAPKPGRGPHKKARDDNKAIDFMLKTSWSSASMSLPADLQRWLSIRASPRNAEEGTRRYSA